MSSNDGQKLLVFGMSFSQHDNRNMQQILRHYGRTPANPGSRAALFVELNNLANELSASADEAAQDQLQQLTGWVQDGGDFPLAVAPPPVNAAEQQVMNRWLGASRHYMGYGWGRTLDEAGVEEDAHDDNQTPPPETGSWHSGDIEDNNEDDNEDENEDDSEDDSQDGVENQDRWEQEVDNMEEDRPTQTSPFHERGRTLDEPEWSGPAAAAPPATVDDHRGTVMNNAAGMHHMLSWEAYDARMGDEEELDGWDAHHPLGLGPGRTLNDPSPALDEVDNQRLHDSDNDDSDNDSSGSEVPEDTVSPATHDVGSAADVVDDAAAAEKMECQVCMIRYPPSSFPKTPASVTELCDHPGRHACLECISASIAEIMKRGRGALHLLSCPVCSHMFTREDIKKYASREVYDRYVYLKKQSETPGHWIACTNPSCDSSQPHDLEGPGGPRMVCNHCHFETCAKHRRPWHAGQTCAEFDMDPAQVRRLLEEEATARLLSREAISICPQCGQGVTKMEGCDHMACQCGTSWCYVCSSSWENIIRLGAAAHATFCIHHPNKVNLTEAQKERDRSRIMSLVHGGEISPELAMAREEFRRRRRDEMRPKVAEAAEARRMKALEEKRKRHEDEADEAGVSASKKRRKVKLVAPWEEV